MGPTEGPSTSLATPTPSPAPEECPSIDLMEDSGVGLSISYDDEIISADTLIGLQSSDDNRKLTVTPSSTITISLTQVSRLVSINVNGDNIQEITLTYTDEITNQIKTVTAVANQVTPLNYDIAGEIEISFTASNEDIDVSVDKIELIACEQSTSAGPTTVSSATSGPPMTSGITGLPSITTVPLVGQTGGPPSTTAVPSTTGATEGTTSSTVAEPSGSTSGAPSTTTAPSTGPTEGPSTSMATPTPSPAPEECPSIDLMEESGVGLSITYDDEILSADTLIGLQSSDDNRKLTVTPSSTVTISLTKVSRLVSINVNGDNIQEITLTYTDEITNQIKTVTAVANQVTPLNYDIAGEIEISFTASNEDIDVSVDKIELIACEQSTSAGPTTVSSATSGPPMTSGITGLPSITTVPLVGQTGGPPSTTAVPSTTGATEGTTSSTVAEPSGSTSGAPSTTTAPSTGPTEGPSTSMATPTPSPAPEECPSIDLMEDSGVGLSITYDDEIISADTLIGLQSSDDNRKLTVTPSSTVTAVANQVTPLNYDIAGEIEISFTASNEDIDVSVDKIELIACEQSTSAGPTTVSSATSGPPMTSGITGLPSITTVPLVGQTGGPPSTTAVPSTTGATEGTTSSTVAEPSGSTSGAPSTTTAPSTGSTEGLSTSMATPTPSPAPEECPSIDLMEDSGVGLSITYDDEIISADTLIGLQSSDDNRKLTVTPSSTVTAVANQVTPLNYDIAGEIEISFTASNEDIDVSVDKIELIACEQSTSAGPTTVSSATSGPPMTSGITGLPSITTVPLVGQTGGPPSTTAVPSTTGATEGTTSSTVAEPSGSTSGAPSTTTAPSTGPTEGPSTSMATPTPSPAPEECPSIDLMEDSGVGLSITYDDEIISADTLIGLQSSDDNRKLTVTPSSTVTISLTKVSRLVSINVNGDNIQEITLTYTDEITNQIKTVTAVANQVTPLNYDIAGEIEISFTASNEDIDVSVDKIELIACEQSTSAGPTTVSSATSGPPMTSGITGLPSITTVPLVGQTGGPPSTTAVPSTTGATEGTTSSTVAEPSGSTSGAPSTTTAPSTGSTEGLSTSMATPTPSPAPEECPSIDLMEDSGVGLSITYDDEIISADTLIGLQSSDDNRKLTVTPSSTVTAVANQVTPLNYDIAGEIEISFTASNEDIDVSVDKIELIACEQSTSAGPTTVSSATSGPPMTSGITGLPSITTVPLVGQTGGPPSTTAVPSTTGATEGTTSSTVAEPSGSTSGAPSTTTAPSTGPTEGPSTSMATPTPSPAPEECPSIDLMEDSGVGLSITYDDEIISADTLIGLQSSDDNRKLTVTPSSTVTISPTQVSRLVSINVNGDNIQEITLTYTDEITNQIKTVTAVANQVTPLNYDIAGEIEISFTASNEDIDVSVDKIELIACEQSTSAGPTTVSSATSGPPMTSGITGLPSITTVPLVGQTGGPPSTTAVPSTTGATEGTTSSTVAEPSGSTSGAPSTTTAPSTGPTEGPSTSMATPTPSPAPEECPSIDLMEDSGVGLSITYDDEIISADTLIGLQSSDDNRKLTVTPSSTVTAVANQVTPLNYDIAGEIEISFTASNEDIDVSVDKIELIACEQSTSAGPTTVSSATSGPPMTSGITGLPSITTVPLVGQTGGPPSTTAVPSTTGATEGTTSSTVAEPSGSTSGAPSTTTAPSTGPTEGPSTSMATPTPSPAPEECPSIDLMEDSGVGLSITYDDEIISADTLIGLQSSDDNRKLTVTPSSTVTAVANQVTPLNYDIAGEIEISFTASNEDIDVSVDKIELIACEQSTSAGPTTVSSATSGPPMTSGITGLPSITTVPLVGQTGGPPSTTAVPSTTGATEGTTSSTVAEPSGSTSGAPSTTTAPSTGSTEGLSTSMATPTPSPAPEECPSIDLMEDSGVGLSITYDDEIISADTLIGLQSSDDNRKLTVTPSSTVTAVANQVTPLNYDIAGEIEISFTASNEDIDVSVDKIELIACEQSTSAGPTTVSSATSGPPMTSGITGLPSITTVPLVGQTGGPPSTTAVPSTTGATEGTTSSTVAEPSGSTSGAPSTTTAPSTGSTEGLSTSMATPTPSPAPEECPSIDLMEDSGVGLSITYDDEIISADTLIGLQSSDDNRKLTVTPSSTVTAVANQVTPLNYDIAGEIEISFTASNEDIDVSVDKIELIACEQSTSAGPTTVSSATSGPPMTSGITGLPSITTVPLVGQTGGPPSTTAVPSTTGATEGTTSSTVAEPSGSTSGAPSTTTAPSTGPTEGLSTSMATPTPSPAPEECPSIDLMEDSGVGLSITYDDEIISADTLIGLQSSDDNRKLTVTPSSTVTAVANQVTPLNYDIAGEIEISFTASNEDIDVSVDKIELIACEQSTSAGPTTVSSATSGPPMTSGITGLPSITTVPLVGQTGGPPSTTAVPSTTGATEGTTSSTVAEPSGSTSGAPSTTTAPSTGPTEGPSTSMATPTPSPAPEECPSIDLMEDSGVGLSITYDDEIISADTLIGLQSSDDNRKLTVTPSSTVTAVANQVTPLNYDIAGEIEISFTASNEDIDVSVDKIELIACEQSTSAGPTTVSSATSGPPMTSGITGLPSITTVPLVGQTGGPPSTTAVPSTTGATEGTTSSTVAEPSGSTSGAPSTTTAPSTGPTEGPSTSMATPTPSPAPEECPSIDLMEDSGVGLSITYDDEIISADTLIGLQSSDDNRKLTVTPSSTVTAVANQVTPLNYDIAGEIEISFTASNEDIDVSVDKIELIACEQSTSAGPTTVSSATSGPPMTSGITGLPSITTVPLVGQTGGPPSTTAVPSTTGATEGTTSSTVAEPSGSTSGAPSTTTAPSTGPTEGPSTSMATPTPSPAPEECPSIDLMEDSGVGLSITYDDEIISADTLIGLQSSDDNRKLTVTPSSTVTAVANQVTPLNYDIAGEIEISFTASNEDIDVSVDKIELIACEQSTSAGPTTVSSATSGPPMTSGITGLPSITTVPLVGQTGGPPSTTAVPSTTGATEGTTSSTVAEPSGSTSGAPSTTTAPSTGPTEGPSTSMATPTPSPAPEECPSIDLMEDSGVGLSITYDDEIISADTLIGLQSSDDNRKLTVTPSSTVTAVANQVTPLNYDIAGEIEISFTASNEDIDVSVDKIELIACEQSTSAGPTTVSSATSGPPMTSGITGLPSITTVPLVGQTGGPPSTTAVPSTTGATEGTTSSTVAEPSGSTSGAPSTTTAPSTGPTEGPSTSMATPTPSPAPEECPSIDLMEDSGVGLSITYDDEIISADTLIGLQSSDDNRKLTVTPSSTVTAVANQVTPLNYDIAGEIEISFTASNEDIDVSVDKIELIACEQSTSAGPTTVSSATSGPPMTSGITGLPSITTVPLVGQTGGPPSTTAVPSTTGATEGTTSSTVAEPSGSTSGAPSTTTAPSTGPTEGPSTSMATPTPSPAPEECPSIDLMEDSGVGLSITYDDEIISADTLIGLQSSDDNRKLTVTPSSTVTAVANQVTPLNYDIAGEIEISFTASNEDIDVSVDKIELIACEQSTSAGPTTVSSATSGPPMTSGITGLPSITTVPLVGQTGGPPSTTAVPSTTGVTEGTTSSTVAEPSGSTSGAPSTTTAPSTGPTEGLSTSMATPTPSPAPEECPSIDLIEDSGVGLSITYDDEIISADTLIGLQSSDDNRKLTVTPSSTVTAVANQVTPLNYDIAGEIEISFTASNEDIDVSVDKIELIACEQSTSAGPTTVSSATSGPPMTSGITGLPSITTVPLVGQTGGPPSTTAVPSTTGATEGTTSSTVAEPSGSTSGAPSTTTAPSTGPTEGPSTSMATPTPSPAPEECPSIDLMEDSGVGLSITYDDEIISADTLIGLQSSDDNRKLTVTPSSTVTAVANQVTPLNYDIAGEIEISFTASNEDIDVSVDKIELIACEQSTSAGPTTVSSATSGPPMTSGITGLPSITTVPLVGQTGGPPSTTAVPSTTGATEGTTSSTVAEPSGSTSGAPSTTTAPSTGPTEGPSTSMATPTPSPAPEECPSIDLMEDSGVGLSITYDDEIISADTLIGLQSSDDNRKLTVTPSSTVTAVANQVTPLNYDIAGEIEISFTASNEDIDVSVDKIELIACEQSTSAGPTTVSSATSGPPMTSGITGLPSKTTVPLVGQTGGPPSTTAVPSTTGATEGTTSSTVAEPSGSTSGAPSTTTAPSTGPTEGPSTSMATPTPSPAPEECPSIDLMEDSGVGLSITYDDEIISADTLIGLQSSDDNRKLTVTPSSTVTISLTQVSRLVSINVNGDNIQEITLTYTDEITNQIKTVTAVANQVTPLNYDIAGEIEISFTASNEDIDVSVDKIELIACEQSTSAGPTTVSSATSGPPMTSGITGLPSITTVPLVGQTGGPPSTTAVPSTTGATEGTTSSTVAEPSGSTSGAPSTTTAPSTGPTEGPSTSMATPTPSPAPEECPSIDLMEDSGVGLSITYDDEIISADTLIGLQSSDDNRKLTVTPSSTVTISLTQVSRLVSINVNGDNIQEITLTYTDEITNQIKTVTAVANQVTPLNYDLAGEIEISFTASNEDIDVSVDKIELIACEQSTSAGPTTVSSATSGPPMTSGITGLPSITTVPLVGQTGGPPSTTAVPSTTGATEGTTSSTVAEPSGSTSGAPSTTTAPSTGPTEGPSTSMATPTPSPAPEECPSIDLMEDSGVGLSITYDDEIISADTLIGLQSSDDNRKLTVTPSSTVTISLTQVSRLVSINVNGDNIQEITLTYTDEITNQIKTVTAVANQVTPLNYDIAGEIEISFTASNEDIDVSVDKIELVACEQSTSAGPTTVLSATSGPPMTSGITGLPSITTVPLVGQTGGPPSTTAVPSTTGATEGTTSSTVAEPSGSTSGAPSTTTAPSTGTTEGPSTSMATPTPSPAPEECPSIDLMEDSGVGLSITYDDEIISADTLIGLQSSDDNRKLTVTPSSTVTISLTQVSRLVSINVNGDNTQEITLTYTDEITNQIKTVTAVANQVTPLNYDIAGEIEISFTASNEDIDVSVDKIELVACEQSTSAGPTTVLSATSGPPMTSGITGLPSITTVPLVGQTGGPPSTTAVPSTTGATEGTTSSTVAEPSGSTSGAPSTTTAPSTGPTEGPSTSMATPTPSPAPEECPSIDLMEDSGVGLSITYDDEIISADTLIGLQSSDDNRKLTVTPSSTVTISLTQVSRLVSINVNGDNIQEITLTYTDEITNQIKTVTAVANQVTPLNYDIAGEIEISFTASNEDIDVSVDKIELVACEQSTSAGPTTVLSATSGPPMTSGITGLPSITTVPLVGQTGGPPSTTAVPSTTGATEGTTSSTVAEPSGSTSGAPSTTTAPSTGTTEGPSTSMATPTPSPAPEECPSIDLMEDSGVGLSITYDDEIISADTLIGLQSSDDNRKLTVTPSSTVTISLTQVSRLVSINVNGDNTQEITLTYTDEITNQIKTVTAVANQVTPLNYDIAGEIEISFTASNEDIDVSVDKIELIACEQSTSAGPTTVSSATSGPPMTSGITGLPSITTVPLVGQTGGPPSTTAVPSTTGATEGTTSSTVAEPSGSTSGAPSTTTAPSTGPTEGPSTSMATPTPSPAPEECPSIDLMEDSGVGLSITYDDEIISADTLIGLQSSDDNRKLTVTPSSTVTISLTQVSRLVSINVNGDNIQEITLTYTDEITNQIKTVTAVANHVTPLNYDIAGEIEISFTASNEDIDVSVDKIELIACEQSTSAGPTTVSSATSGPPMTSGISGLPSITTVPLVGQTGGPPSTTAVPSTTGATEGTTSSTVAEPSGSTSGAPSTTTAPSTGPTEGPSTSMATPTPSPAPEECPSIDLMEDAGVGLSITYDDEIISADILIGLQSSDDNRKLTVTPSSTVTISLTQVSRLVSINVNGDNIQEITLTYTDEITNQIKTCESNQN
ncbi:mucin-17-like [Mytilus californianus]|uniref:mucin-17-like n=1 Tax=Mytilus californianus TaxID=6549 RepID=UPI002246B2DC|nr:mucin-17-like [Mytilus californianus]